MITVPQRLKTLRFAVSVIVVVLLGVAVGTLIGTSGKVPDSLTAQEGLPLVTSATSAIRVVGLERTAIGSSSILNVSLQNTSRKTIKAYSVGSGKAWVTTRYYASETAFPPDAIKIDIIPLDSGTFRGTSREFTVTGVIFEDGTTDGQAIPVLRLREHWVGFRDYASRLLPCLRRLPSTFTPQNESTLADCETEAAKLSAQGRSSDYEDGFQNAHSETSTQLSEMKSKIRSGDFSSAAKQKDKTIKILESFQHP